MTSRLLIALSFLWLPAVIVFGSAPAVFSLTPAVFVDCDGDGFDDNAPDDDLDGIPDEFECHSFISAPAATLGVSQMFTGGEPRFTTPARSRSSDGFGRRKFAARAVCENRLDFDAGFGSSLGLGGGLGSGGGCAGGVCF